ncbi:beta-1,4-galactosyltransferase 3-like isoform X2 [Phasianus colchicus]|uniref:beta-1,4-galactosyltransferase 3-like isoform X2 n=1 Tax=Phasianus colchicus TaxID=9054 RepID=UPI00129E6B15|nr:beta-1,4-galactosyltransferase 3-like isoform X2 [Phasianus colchicus]
MSLSRVENPCFLLFLLVFQAVFILILYRGGASSVFRGFLESQRVLDYSKSHDVYTNLSLLVPAGGGAALPYCSAHSPIAVGPLAITFDVLPSERMIIQKNPFVQSGGQYRPPHCLARYKSAILVAYSNQEKYLHHLLYYIHPFLQRQQLSYRIYLIQQVGNGTFNRAKLLNVGVREALKDEDWDCLLLHDVDLVPENDYNLYVCDEYYPKHVASAMDKFQYKIQLAGMRIVRTPPHLGRYKAMDYKRETEEPWRRPASYHNTGKTWKDDGMNSLEFKLLSRTKHPLYTNITVDIGYVPPFS